MKEHGENIEETIRRELHEETGLFVKEVVDILPPAYAAVAISDVQNQIAIVKATGSLSNLYLSDNEDIEARFYTKEEVQQLLQTEKFSSRAQAIAYFYTKGYFDK
jgi:ADP-ribose pyrophosphatase